MHPRLHACGSFCLILKGDDQKNEDYVIYLHQILQTCHNMGFRNVLVETNSSFAFSMVTLGMPESHICKSLLQAIRNLYDSDWQVEFSLIYREANMCADSLAKVGHRLTREVTFFDRLPACCQLAFLVDSVGHGCPRIVNC